MVSILLVNDKHPLDKDIKMDLISISKNLKIARIIYQDLYNMLDEMIKLGYHPIICSAYRSFMRQSELYDKKCIYYLKKGYDHATAENFASQWVAKPGCSEHQTGLALDIVSLDYQQLDEKQEKTKEQQWLINNSWRYGFILRYPKGKEAMTHVHYEPWHYRYVGVEAATEIFNRKITLEEYLEITDE